VIGANWGANVTSATNPGAQASLALGSRWRGFGGDDAGVSGDGTLAGTLGTLVWERWGHGTLNERWNQWWGVERWGRREHGSERWGLSIFGRNVVERWWERWGHSIFWERWWERWGHSIFGAASLAMGSCVLATHRGALLVRPHAEREDYIAVHAPRDGEKTPRAFGEAFGAFGVTASLVASLVGVIWLGSQHLWRQHLWRGVAIWRFWVTQKALGI
jgi:hypothetical protein